MKLRKRSFRLGYPHHRPIRGCSTKWSRRRVTAIMRQASEQLTFRPGSDNVQIRVVDTDLYTSWVDGRFVFRDETIEEIMRKLERWYNFKTRFESSGLKSYRFGVNIDKYDNITPILKVLESTGTLRFELEGDTILIKKGINTN